MQNLLAQEGSVAMNSSWVIRQLKEEMEIGINVLEVVFQPQRVEKLNDITHGFR